MDSQTPSGIPYLAYLSGLNLGQGGQSGVTDPSLSGQPAQGNGIGGAAGGLGLDELSALLAAQQGSDVAGSAGTPFTQGIGTLGGFGNLGQGAGSYFQAGGTQAGQQQQGAGAGIAGGTGGGVDPMAVLKQALGLVQKGAGLIPGQQGSYGTAGDTGVSLSDQLRSGQSGIASPTVDQLGQSLLSANTLSDTLRSIPEGTATVGQPQITGYGTIGAGGTTGGAIPFGTFDTSKLEQGLGLPSGTLANFSPDEISQIMGGSLTPDQLQQVLGVGETGAGYASPGQLSNLSGYQASTPATSPTNIGGALQGGAGAGIGLLNLIQGIQGGNVPGGIGGGLQSIGGLASLLQSSPALAQSLGLSSGALGAAGAGAGGLGGLLGLYSGIQGLLNGGNVGGSLANLGGGALSTYGALSTLLPEVFPSLTGALASGLTSVAPGLASTLGVGAGAAGAAGAGAGGAGAAGGAAAGGAAAGAGGALAGAGGVIALPLVMGAILSAFHQGGNIADIWGGTEDNPDAYQTFNTRLMNNEKLQGQGINFLQQALPYAQSQQDLQNILAQYKSYVPGGNEALKQYMSQDPWTLSAIPGVGSETHGQQTTPMDWNPVVQRDQAIINQLRQMLPETGGSPLDAGALWNQVASNYANQQQINSGLDLGILQYLTPEQQAGVLAGFQSPTPITAPMSSAFQSLFPGYQPMQLSQLPKVAAPAPSSAIAPSGWVMNTPLSEGPVGGYTYVGGPAGAGTPADYEAFTSGGM